MGQREVLAVHAFFRPVMKGTLSVPLKKQESKMVMGTHGAKVLCP